MRYIQKLANSGAVQTALDQEELGKPYMVYLEDEHRIDWNGLSPTPPISAQYLTIEVLSAGTISWKTKGIEPYAAAPIKTIQYSKNGGEWTSITSSTAGTSFSVNAGDVVRFKGNNKSYAPGIMYPSAYCWFNISAPFKLYGNIFSLSMGDNFTGETSDRIVDGHGMYGLFSDNSNLIEVTELAFGRNVYSIALYGAYSFKNLFNGCTNLNYVKSLCNGIKQEMTTIFADWLANTSSTGTFVKHPDATWPGIPEGWTVVDADI